MSEHTPGPWEYDGGAQIVEVERTHMRVCFLPSDHHRYASSKANARLIAAAPDLLAAAHLTLGYLNGTCTCNESSGCTAAMLRARLAAAIAKTEGRHAG